MSKELLAGSWPKTQRFLSTTVSSHLALQVSHAASLCRFLLFQGGVDVMRAEQQEPEEEETLLA